MSNSISSISSTPSWENIKETSLKNENLNADVRVGDGPVQVNAPGILDEVEIKIGLEKEPVYASREETLTNLRDLFGLDFSQKLRTLIQETGIRTDSEEYKTLVTHAMQSFDVITQKLTTTIATSAVSTSQAIQEAHLGSLNSLALLKQQFAQPQQTPQFCVTKEGQISVLQPAPHAENLVLSGGGVKGAGYVGWFKAAERAGALKTIKRLAGSSAGAITAALMASGMSADDFEKANNRTSFWRILTGNSRDPVINQATQLETKGCLSCFSFSGTYAVDHINQEMVGSINTYFKKFKNQDALNSEINARFTSDSSISKEDKDKFKKILSNLYQKIAPPPPHWLFGSWFQKKQQTYMVTFQDLATLTEIDPRFKELTVTGYDVTKKQEIYYNAKDYPGEKIAEAVRISMSLPLVFQPILNPETGDVLEDGGIGSNTPTEVFVRDGAGEEELEQARAKTLVLGFDNNGRFYDITSEGVIHKRVDWASASLSGNPNFQKRSDWDAQKLYDPGPNAMDVEHGTLNTTSFMATKSSLDAAQRQAEIRATEAFSLRQNQSELKSIGQALSDLRSHPNHPAVDSLFASLKHAMKAMTSPELEKIKVVYGLTPPQYDPDCQKKENECIVQAAEKELATRSQLELPLSV
ncbi:MAG: patatin-like phospholipase family protein [Verrucomicrobiae bacterium]|nr:patatin-like phospholipase family protein [Verrucomicrobiae bacterium]